VSNLEKAPPLVELVEGSVDRVSTSSTNGGSSTSGGIELLDYREVPLGGPRALTVRRTLPQKQRSLIGAWCFVDSYGPDPVSGRGAMTVPPHPHTGLQTVSWLYAGEIEHRDSAGSFAMVEPGAVNMMTAGAGIQHSEVSTDATTSLHGVQLWVALPDASRGVGPFFEHYVPTPIRHGDATLRVFVGDLLGQCSTVTAFTRLLGVQVDLPAGGSVTIPVDPTFEHGLIVDAGSPTLQGVRVETAQLAFVPAGARELTVEAGSHPLRALLIGGEPLGERILMWWNFVGRTHEEVVAYREQWMAEVISGATDSGRFGHVDGYPGSALPAPELPNVRLRPRD
jgi:redox-sensitive bicupin YhaK (pirin superfamily)